MRIELAAPDPGWAFAFRTVEELIRDSLGPAALVIEHVGSTAVPELPAKPIIDVVLVVENSVDEPAFVPALESVGFTFHVREPDWHEHRLLKLNDPLSNLHVFSFGCPEVGRMVSFRDLLRADKQARAVYESKKRELTQQEWPHVQDYADAKTEVVETLLSAAGR